MEQYDLFSGKKNDSVRRRTFPAGVASIGQDEATKPLLEEPGPPPGDPTPRSWFWTFFWLLLFAGAITLGVFGLIAFIRVSSDPVMFDNLKIAESLDAWGNVTLENVTVIGPLDAQGDVTAKNLTVTGWVNVNGHITTDSLSLRPTMHTQNGSIPSDSNNHAINCDGPQCDLDLPLDETYVDKVMCICSVDGKKNTITLPGGMFWDRKNSFPVLQFEENEMPCCVTFKIVAVDKIDVLSKSCALFCTDTIGTHCIDPDRPFETNRWHGWFRQDGVIQDGGAQYVGPYIFVDATESPISLHRPIGWGTVKYPTAEAGPTVAMMPRDVGNPDILITGTNSDLGDLTYNQGAAQYTMQAGGKTVLAQALTLQYFLQYPLRAGRTNFFAKLDVQAPPTDVSWIPNIDTPMTDLDSPVELFTRWTDILLETNEYKVPAAVSAGQAVDYYEIDNLRNSMLSGDVTYTVPLHLFFNTQEAGLTILRTTTYHHCVAYGRVTLSGFTGPYSALNGNTYGVSQTGTTQNKFALETGQLYRDYGPDPDARTVHHDCAIFLDSSGFPFNATTGRGDFTGTPMVTVTYPRVTPDMEYREFVASLLHFHAEFAMMHLHPSWFFQLKDDPASGLFPTEEINPIEVADTWAEVAAIANPFNDFWNYPNWRWQDNAATAYYTGHQYTSSALAASLGAPPSSIVPGGNLHIIGGDLIVNSRFGNLRQSQNVTDDSIPYNYDITRSNYVVDEKVPFWRTAGAPNFGIFPEVFTTLAIPQLGQGSTVETLLIDFGAHPPVNEGWSMFNPQLPINVQNSGPPFFFNPGWPAAPPTMDPYNTFLSTKQMELAGSACFFGVINPEYTSGKTIGYVRIKRAAPTLLFSVGTNSLLAPQPLNGVTDIYEVAKSGLRDGMHYLVTEKGVDDLIIDFRGSIGSGAYSSSMTSRLMQHYLGTQNRTLLSGSNARTYSQNGLRPPIDVNTLDGLDMPDEVAYPSVQEALFPGTVFMGGNVYVLAEYGRNGAAITDFFMNATGGDDIGGGTIVKVVGEIKTATSPFIPSYAVASFPNPSSRVGSPFYGRAIGAQGPHPVDLHRPDGTEWGIRAESNSADPLSGYSGLAGGPALPSDLENLLYPDLGFVPNTRPRLTGDLRPQQPDPTNNTQYRDTWLEAVIEEACAKKKRAVRDDQTRSALAAEGRAILAAHEHKKRNTRQAIAYKRCVPPQNTLTPLANATFSSPVPYPVGFDATEAAVAHAAKMAETMFMKQVNAGHVCLDDHSVLCVTQDIGPMPKLVPQMRVTPGRQ